jgi:hypothetical protein
MLAVLAIGAALGVVRNAAIEAAGGTRSTGAEIAALVPWWKAVSGTTGAAAVGVRAAFAKG